MSKYTTEVRYVCESIAKLRKSRGYLSIDGILENSYADIFGDFPIFDEEYRKYLCCKILKHYYTREICEETVGLWKLRMNTVINEVMPYYNQLYKTTMLDFDIFDNVSIEKVITKNSSGESGGTQEQTGEGLSAFSDTPQGMLSGVEEGNYLTNATKNTQKGTGKNTNNFKQDDKETEVTKGKNTLSSNSKLLTEYRNTLLNIDIAVINEFKDCFIQLW